MKKLLLLIGCSAFTFFASGQTPDKKLGIGFHGGFAQYNGDLGQNFYAKDQAAYGFGSISLSRYLGPHWDISFFGTRGEIGNIEKQNAENTTPKRFRASMNTLNMVFRFNMLKPVHTLRPYLMLGFGGIVFDKGYSVPKTRLDAALPTLGGGLTWRLGEVVSIQLQETFLYTDKDDIDGEVDGYNDGFLFHTAGLVFSLGKKIDTDFDGVADRSDNCPNTPTGILVDKKGCPFDKDGDGAADYEDDCPDFSGLMTLKGCPDRDIDGIADKNDACPDVAGPIAMNGCPDSDNDGITDKDDRCPNVAGTTGLSGCPDADSDGVADLDDKCGNTKLGYKVDATGCSLDNDKDGINNEEDRCPDAPGALALKGCPDSDLDGVSDADDRCPRIKGTLVNKGCPEIAKEDIKKITSIASKIYFEFNSVKLKSESLPQLDALVDILKKYEAANISIEGHTDNVGDDEYNHKLSHQRTESVKAYLMLKGIFESRLTATGFGETAPIADNKNEAGRTKNRRVELKTSY